MKKILIILLIFLLYILLDTGKSYSLKNPTNLEFTPLDTNSLETELVNNLSKLIQIPTIRGNEREACLYIQAILAKEGIPSRIYADPNHPTRANLVAELKGESNENGIILMNHLDVVEADSKEWKFPPFSGKVENGNIYGRGAMDMKGMAIMELFAFISIKRAGIKLKSNLMFLALADEESTSEKGAKYMLRNHPEVFKGYKYALNEGGLGTKNVAFDNTKIFNLQYAEKGIVWFKIHSTGNSGHGSSPPNSYASLELLHFVKEVLDYDRKMTITTETEMYFSSIAEVAGFPTSILLQRISNPVIGKIIQPKIQSNRHLNAMTSNTKSLTGFEIPNSGVNVISNEAKATIDIRILPGVDPEKYYKELESMIQNRNIKMEKILLSPATVSPIDSIFYTNLYQVLKKNVPQSTVAPFLSPGGTDSKYFRDTGIEAFGLIPGLFTSEEIDGYHGKDEYMKIENLLLGTKIIYETILTYNQFK